MVNHVTSNASWLCSTKPAIGRLPFFATRRPCDDPTCIPRAQTEAPTAFRPISRHQYWMGAAEGKSYSLPAYEYRLFEFLLNRYDHYVVDAHVYESPISNFKTIRIASGWSTTTPSHQPFLLLPGCFLPRVARSSGLDFWESSAYTFAAACCGKWPARPPSLHQRSSRQRNFRNLLGEPLFRMASLLLETVTAETAVVARVAAAVYHHPWALPPDLWQTLRRRVPRNDPPCSRASSGRSSSTTSVERHVNADLSAPPAAKLQAAKRKRAVH